MKKIKNNNVLLTYVKDVEITSDYYKIKQDRERKGLIVDLSEGRSFLKNQYEVLQRIRVTMCTEVLLRDFLKNQT